MTIPLSSRPGNSRLCRRSSLSLKLFDIYLLYSYMNKEFRMTCPQGIHQARAWLKVLGESLEIATKMQEESFGSAVKNVTGDIIKATTVSILIRSFLIQMCIKAHHLFRAAGSRRRARSDTSSSPTESSPGTIRTPLR